MVKLFNNKQISSQFDASFVIYDHSALTRLATGFGHFLKKKRHCGFRVPTFNRASSSSIETIVDDIFVSDDILRKILIQTYNNSF